MKGFSQADASPKRRTRSIRKNQEDESVEEFLKSDVARTVPCTTHNKFGLLSHLEQTVGIKGSSLPSDSRRRVGQCVDHLIDEVTRATRNVDGDRLQTEIEAQWGPRCKDWLHRQLAQQREAVVAEHWQRWQDKEGATFRKRLDEAYNNLVEDYKLRWENGESYNYHKFLKAQLREKVEAELREELRPAVMAELRDNLTPYAQWEDLKDTSSEIRRYQNTLQFAQSVDARLRAQNRDRNESADSEQDGQERNPSLQRVIKASERLNWGLEHGSPEGSESREDTRTSAYSKGLFGIFPLKSPDSSQHIHHPQQIQSQSSYIPDAISERTGAVRDHGIVGLPIVPPRVQALKHDAIATESTPAPSAHSHQPVPASGAGQSSSTLAADREAMPPPSRAAGPKLPRHLQAARYDRTSLQPMTEVTVSQPLYGADKILTESMLPEVCNRTMSSTCAHQQAYRDQHDFFSAQIGESRSSIGASWICNEAIEDGCGRPGPADQAANTENIHDHTQGQNQGTVVQTKSPALQATRAVSGLSQKNEKKRRRLEDDEIDNVDIGSSTNDSKDEAAKAENKRACLDLAQRRDLARQNEEPIPYTYNRAAALKAAAEKLKARSETMDLLTRTSGETTTVTRAAAVIDSSTASSPTAGAMIPSDQSPFQASCSRRMKGNYDPSESEQEIDEPRASPSPATRVRHTPMEDSTGAAANPYVAALLSTIASRLSSVAPTDTAEDEESTADQSRIRGEAAQAISREKAEASPQRSIGEEDPAVLGSPFNPYSDLKRSEHRTEWDSDSDD
ncbi:MAG: hypothetical protein Q9209_007800 [Squamulea sp. 1 TL-2023]